MAARDQTPLPQSPTQPRAGETALPGMVGKYRIKARLGEGATSEVFLAYDPFRGQDVAIKRVRRNLLEEDARETHFQQRFFAAEAALVGRLNHPNVVQILDAVDDPVAPYLVMEYVKGVTLRRFCRADALLPLATVIEIGFKCAMALGYVFKQGLIHRDVKPANLMVTLDGDRINEVKITDFGSVFNLDRRPDADLPRGQPGLHVARAAGRRCARWPRRHLFAGSAVLYHLIAGRPPFRCADPAAGHHAPDLPRHAARLWARCARVCPRQLQALIERCLAKEPPGPAPGEHGKSLRRPCRP